MAAVVLALALAVSGQATWYGTGPGAGHAAAGPALRQALGKDWRGKVVQVCADRCVTVKLTDWCLCRGQRVIDLSDEDFSRLAPLTAGVIRVTVSRVSVVPPPTDAVVHWTGRTHSPLPC